jgi:hypothetical protein
MHLQIAVPDRHVSAEVLNPVLEATTRLNERMMRAGEIPGFTTMLRRGVRWRKEPPGAERFDHGKIVSVRGWGDCDDLGPIRAAELRASGEDVGARSFVYKSGPHKWHAVVLRSDGRVEDPSRAAGMGKSEVGAAAPVIAPMFRPNGRAHVATYGNRRRGYHARVDLPARGSDHALVGTAIGRTPSEALCDAIYGVCVVGDEIAEPAPFVKLLALDAILRGHHPESVKQEMLARGLITRANTVHGESVGDFFGDVVKVAAPIAGGALGGPLGAAAGGMFGNLVTSALSQQQAATPGGAASMPAAPGNGGGGRSTSVYNPNPSTIFVRF